MTLSPAAARICEVSVGHLADHGYDGSSLNDIARLAGMRKASLYSHFDGKDALIAEVLSLASAEERRFVYACFEADTGRPPGGEYLAGIGDRYAASPHLRFLLRTAYAPPVAIRQDIISRYRAFLDDIRTLFVVALGDDRDPAAVRLLADGYLGMVDSLQVELLHGDVDGLRDRRTALWTMFKLLDETEAHR